MGAGVAGQGPLGATSSGWFSQGLPEGSRLDSSNTESLKEGQQAGPSQHRSLCGCAPSLSHQFCPCHHGGAGPQSPRHRSPGPLTERAPTLGRGKNGGLIRWLRGESRADAPQGEMPSTELRKQVRDTHLAGASTASDRKHSGLCAISLAPPRSGFAFPTTSRPDLPGEESGGQTHSCSRWPPGGTVAAAVCRTRQACNRARRSSASPGPSYW